MQEILPGIFHWTARHEGIGMDVSSYLVVPAAAVIDPMIPEDGGLDAVTAHVRPERIILTSGLHRRHAERFAQEFGCPILLSREGAERVGDALEVQTYGDGDEVAPGITAIHIGALCPDEYALHIAVGEGALVVADGIITYGGVPGFVPDGLLGDDPEQVKAGLRDAYRAQLDRDWATLLPAHGEPLAGTGKAALREFVGG